jgi:hypothetical protein
MIKLFNVIGMVSFGIGLWMVIYSQFIMKTTVESSYTGTEISEVIELPTEVNNIGLISDKLNTLILGGILLIVGFQIAEMKEYKK